MIAGFAKPVDGPIRQLDSVDALCAAWSDEHTLVWVDLEQPSEADLHGLNRVIELDPASLEDCLHGEQRPRIDEFEGYLFLVLYGMLGVRDEEFMPRKLAAFLGPRFLITVHPESLRTIVALRERCARGASNKVLSDGVDTILFQIIDGMVDKYLFVAENYEEQLEALEERSLEPHVDESVLADGGALRSKLLDLRRLAVSQRELVLPLAKSEFDFVSEALESRFRHVADHLTQVIEVTDSVRERLNGVRDNYHTALANRTNAAMKTLTLLATIMLPMTLIAGIYGMNLPIWPPADHPLSFWIVLGFMVLVSGGLFAFFRRMRLF